MTPPRVIVRYFGSKDWARMSSVLSYTIQQHCPHWVADVQRFDPPCIGASPLGLNQNVCNTQKLDEWADIIQALPDGERVLLLDADTAILRPLDPVWDLAFDVAITTKPKESRHPLNGGVVFLRVSPASRTFMHEWMTTNKSFFEDPREHQVWRPAYGGMNQSALGALIHQRRLEGLNLLRLPCAEWNVEDEHWDAFDPTVGRILHLKTDLRHQTLSGAPRGEFRRLGKLWLALEAASKAMVAA